jgi:glycosyltransferase involved in cell wall biosynthesis
MNKYKILMVGPGIFRGGGVAYYEKALAQEFSKKGNRIVILGVDRWDPGKKYSYLEEIQGPTFPGAPDMKVFDLVSNGAQYFGSYNPIAQCIDYSAEEAFSAFLRSEKPDVVHFHAARPLSLIRNCFNLNYPTIVSLHDYWYLCCLGFLIRKNGDFCGGPVKGANCARYCHREEGIEYWVLKMLSKKMDMKRIKKLKSLLYYLKNMLPGGGKEKVAKTGTKANMNVALNVLTHWTARYYSMSHVLSQRTDLIIAVSEFVRDYHLEQLSIPHHKIKVVYSGYENAEGFFDKEPKVSDGKYPIKFLYLSPIFREKGLHLLIEAFKGLPADKAELYIYGNKSSDDYYYQMENECRKLKNVRFLGQFSSYDDLPKIYSNIDIAVVPPIMLDTSPRVIWEAKSAKTPVIASRVGGIPDFVKDGVDGLLFERGNASDLRDKMLYFIEDPQQIKRFAKNITKVKSVDQHVDELLDIYSSIIEAKKKR